MQSMGPCHENALSQWLCQLIVTSPMSQILFPLSAAHPLVVQRLEVWTQSRNFSWWPSQRLSHDPGYPAKVMGIELSTQGPLWTWFVPFIGLGIPEITGFMSSKAWYCCAKFFCGSWKQLELLSFTTVSMSSISKRLRLILVMKKASRCINSNCKYITIYMHINCRDKWKVLARMT